MSGAQRSNVRQPQTSQEDVRTFMQRLPTVLQNMSLQELRALDRALLQAGKGQFRSQQPHARTSTGASTVSTKRTAPRTQGSE